MNQSVKKDLDAFFFTYKNHQFLLDPLTQFFWKLQDKNLSLIFYSKNNFSLDYLSQTSSCTSIKKTLSDMHSLSRRGYFVQKRNHPKGKRERKRVRNIQYIIINPTHDCNLDCWYCYASKLREKEKNSVEPSFKFIKKTIDYFLNRHSQKSSSEPFGINLFYTSEITLHFKLFQETLDYLSQVKTNYPFPIYLFPPSTNFLEPSPAFVNYINNYGHLIVSLDYSNKKQIETALQNLNKIQENTTKQVIIPYHPDKGTFHDIYADMKEYFDIISIRPARLGLDMTKKWDITSIHDFQQDLSSLISYITELNDHDLFFFLSSLGPSDYLSRFLNRVITRTKINNRCPAAIKAITIDPNGEFYPCSGLIGQKKYCLGSINQGFVLKSNSLNTFSKFVDQNENCEKCPIKYFCGGHCIEWGERIKPSVSYSECTINLEYIKACIYLAYHLKTHRTSVFNEYLKEKKIKNRLNYPLYFEDFSTIFR